MQSKRLAETCIDLMHKYAASGGEMLMPFQDFIKHFWPEVEERNMTDLPSFIRALEEQDDPHDVAVRQVYADWWAETGKAGDEEGFVRLWDRWYQWDADPARGPAPIQLFKTLQQMKRLLPHVVPADIYFKANWRPIFEKPEDDVPVGFEVSAKCIDSGVLKTLIHADLTVNSQPFFRWEPGQLFCRYHRAIREEDGTWTVTYAFTSPPDIYVAAQMPITRDDIIRGAGGEPSPFVGTGDAARLRPFLYLDFNLLWPTPHLLSPDTPNTPLMDVVDIAAADADLEAGYPWWDDEWRDDENDEEENTILGPDGQPIPRGPIT